MGPLDRRLHNAGEALIYSTPERLTLQRLDSRSRARNLQHPWLTKSRSKTESQFTNKRPFINPLSD